MNLDLPTWSRLNAIVEGVELGPFKMTREEIRKALQRAGAIKIKVNRWRGGCRYTLHYHDEGGQTRFVVCEPYTIGSLQKRRKIRGVERRKLCQT